MRKCTEESPLGARQRINMLAYVEGTLKTHSPGRPQEGPGNTYLPLRESGWPHRGLEKCELNPVERRAKHWKEPRVHFLFEQIPHLSDF